MERNIIQLAKSTLVVSLPKRWLEKQDIHKGDRVMLDEKEDRIVIHTGKRVASQVSLDIKKGQTFTKRHVADLYIRGFDEVTITYADDGVPKVIREEDLLGFEVVEQTKQRVVIKNVAKGIEHEFDTMFRRSFILLKEMGSLVEQKIISHSDIEELKMLEDTVNKFTNFCKRVLNKNGYHPSHKLPFLYSLVRDIEMIGDVYKYLVGDVQALNAKEVAFMKEVNAYVQAVYDLYYTFSEDRVTKMRRDKETLLKKGKELVKTGSLVGHHGLDIVLLVTSMKGPVITMHF